METKKLLLKLFIWRSSAANATNIHPNGQVLERGYLHLYNFGKGLNNITDFAYSFLVIFENLL